MRVGATTGWRTLGSELLGRRTSSLLHNLTLFRTTTLLLLVWRKEGSDLADHLFRVSGLFRRNRGAIKTANLLKSS